MYWTANVRVPCDLPNPGATAGEDAAGGAEMEGRRMNHLHWRASSFSRESDKVGSVAKCSLRSPYEFARGVSQALVGAGVRRRREELGSLGRWAECIGRSARRRCSCVTLRCLASVSSQADDVSPPRSSGASCGCPLDASMEGESLWRASQFGGSRKQYPFGATSSSGDQATSGYL